EAYLPILEALESLLLGRDRETAARAMRAMAPTWWAHLLPRAAAAVTATTAGGAPTESGLHVTSTERLKRELLALLQELGRGRPVVLFLDDVHWADLSTADLLAYLAPRAAPLRLLVLLTYRPSDLVLGKHPLVALQHEWQIHGICREMALQFLGRQDLEQ